MILGKAPLHSKFAGLPQKQTLVLICDFSPIFNGAERKSLLTHTTHAHPYARTPGAGVGPAAYRAGRKSCSHCGGASSTTSHSSSGWELSGTGTLGRSRDRTSSPRWPVPGRMVRVKPNPDVGCLLAGESPATKLCCNLCGNLVQFDYYQSFLKRRGTFNIF